MSTFQVTRRDAQGEKPKHLRKKGLVPMAIVGRDHQTVAVKASVAALRAAVHSADSHGVIEFQIEGESGVRKAMLKSLDGDMIRRVVLSATFQEVSEDDKVKTDIPVVAIGTIPEAEGGENLMLNAVTDVLHIRAKVSDLPDHVEVDVSKLALGDHVSASDLTLPEGVELLSSPDVVLFTVARVPEPVLTTEDTETTAEGETQAEGDAGTATDAS